MSPLHRTLRRWRTLLAFAIALPLALWACSEQASNESPAPVAPPPSETAAPPSPSPQSGDPAAYRGAAIAGQVCAQCHDVGNGASPAVSIPGATAFSEVAGRPETTAETLTAWLRASHPSMPNYIFGEMETTDIVAYIMSLRPDR